MFTSNLMWTRLIASTPSPIGLADLSIETVAGIGFRQFPDIKLSSAGSAVGFQTTPTPGKLAGLAWQGG